MYGSSFVNLKHDPKINEVETTTAMGALLTNVYILIFDTLHS